MRRDAEIRIAAYIHQSIKREGIRDLIQLNPLLFDGDEVIISDLRTKLPTWKLTAPSAIKRQRWERWEQEIDRLGPENIEALRILTLDGPSNDAATMPRLHRIGLAQNWYQVLHGLANNTPFVQEVSGQPPMHRQRDGDRMYEIKAVAREFLEQYFGEHPPR